jgi:hypothetical protein
MSKTIPSVEEVRARLKPLTSGPLRRLAKTTGVGFMTIWNIRTGATEDPGLGTVGRFWAHLPALEREVAKKPPRRHARREQANG